MAHKGQSVLPAEFQLHRCLPWAGNGAVHRWETLCPPFRAAGGGQLYAAVPWRDLPREYAIEGFWYYLFLGVFEAATIHYAVAKIFGPLLFGRGWCGYACWTAMVLDFLPYKQSQKPRRERLGVLRYVIFVLSLALVSGLFLMKTAHLEQIMFWLFLAGNALYYAAGIALAFAFKDNRAFCKYLCPITVFLKPMSYFSLLRVHCDEEKCIHCGKCLRVCPMNVEVNKETRKRKNGTECILCYECTKACPTKALR